MESQIVNKTLEIMEIVEWRLCNRCLGRKFSKVIDAPDNKYRGEYVKRVLAREKIAAGEADSCFICNNIFEFIEKDLIDIIIKKIEKSNIEFSTFLVGCRVSSEILSREEEIQKKLDLDIENIKKEINREIGKRLSFHFKKVVDFENPNLVIMADLVKNNVKLQINPLFIEGRYRKFLRGIPQTKWPCRKCKGDGCQRCNYTGKMYQESVEELISKVIIKTSKAVSAKFHGAGREDIDVRMLGRGRPFVLEVKEPKLRNINLESLEKNINKHAAGKVEVLNLKFTSKERRSVIKSSSRNTYKVYRAVVEFSEDIGEENLKTLDGLEIIEQRTPKRVSHRRADKIRKRKISQIETRKVSPRIIEMIITCEGGLYVKELISGDQDRTKPSVSDLLETDAKCVQLDVLEVNI